MSSKTWVKLLAIGGLGLLCGALIGRQGGLMGDRAGQPVQTPEPAQVASALTLYGGNADATDIETRLTIALPTDLSPDAALAQLVTVISRLEFCGLPIELVNIEEKTATINLAEHPWHVDLDPAVPLPGCAGASWQSTYFQGSTGGLITSKTLTHTLLQPDLAGPWVEGITFQYEGAPMDTDDWDHLDLSGVITRENLP